MTQVLISTQPVPDFLEDSTPNDYETPWGRFYPSFNRNATCGGTFINLTQNSFTVGRYSKCDYTLTKEEVGDKLYDCVSNFQFKVERVEQNDFILTYIKDMSSNGTYLNGNLIGKENTAVLCHNDNIAIAKSSNTVFTFHDLSDQNSEYPEEITKTFVVCNLLGKGGYGEVRLVVKRTTTEKFALKTVDLRPVEEKKVIDVFSEVKILRQLTHENIVKMHQLTLSQDQDTMFLFLEYMAGGDFAHYIKEKTRLSEDITKFIYYQILLGVEYLHSNKILHRDLKPANILLSDKSDYPRVKITDFGLSKIMGDHRAIVHTRCGTLSFAPPELQFRNVSTTYDFRADVWSLGVILYLCLSGVLPFRRDRKDCHLSLEEQIMLANFNFDREIWDLISFRPRLLVKNCLQRLPINRCSVHTILEDEWFCKDTTLMNRIHKLSQFDKENSEEPPMKKPRT